MPLDVFAALGALVRAEAARTRTKPAKPPTDQPPAQRSNSPAPPPVEPPDTAAAPAPAAKRRHPLTRLMQKLTTFIG
ncbi:hypothetical protein [Streptomyces lydicamycinicus]|uniref:hypothetical protein n=1 Tax=Streptomyces lydicamycinicus TaxID=1546107 RepID=UPI003C2BFDB6